MMQVTSIPIAQVERRRGRYLTVLIELPASLVDLRQRLLILFVNSLIVKSQRKPRIVRSEGFKSRGLETEKN